MKGEPACPRCGCVIHAPGLWDSTWHCDEHGTVAPLQPVGHPVPEGLEVLRSKARVPVWVPWPLPLDWLVTGYAHAGDERRLGLGARLAGLAGPDPGTGFGGYGHGGPHAKVDAAGHPTPMWNIDAGPDRAVYVGEAKGAWIWAILWPDAAGLLMLEDLSFADLAEPTGPIDVPLGALMPRLGELGAHPHG
jgi:hypothetical protein